MTENEHLSWAVLDVLDALDANIRGKIPYNDVVEVCHAALDYAEKNGLEKEPEVKQMKKLVDYYQTKNVFC